MHVSNNTITSLLNQYLKNSERQGNSFLEIMSQVSRNNNFNNPQQASLQPVKDSNKTSNIVTTGVKNNAQEIDLDDFFSNEYRTTSPKTLDELPPILFPNAENVSAISEHASKRFQSLLKEYDIPVAPNEITYDNMGNMQLPSDYAYSEELKQALNENPGLAYELNTLNAMSSHFVALQKHLAFQNEYVNAGSKEAADLVLARYSYLWEGRQSAPHIALSFSDSGELNILADSKRVLSNPTTLN